MRFSQGLLRGGSLSSQVKREVSGTPPVSLSDALRTPVPGPPESHIQISLVKSEAASAIAHRHPGGVRAAAGGRGDGATAQINNTNIATGVLPLDYMLRVMRDSAADSKRRDAMAMAAAPYLHPRLSAIDAKPNPDAAERSPRKLLLEFVLPTRDHAREDRE